MYVLYKYVFDTYVYRVGIHIYYIMYRNGLFSFFIPFSHNILLSSLAPYFYSWPWIQLLPPQPPPTTSAARPSPRARYSTSQVIYSLSVWPSRNWKIHPGTRDKTGHIHGSVWFPNLCAATKTSSEIYYCGRDPLPEPPTSPPPPSPDHFPGRF